MGQIIGFIHKNMTVYFIAFVCFLTCSFNVHAQNAPNVFTSDIDNFWIAFDSIQTIKEKDKQIELMKSLYTDKGTNGLKMFMELRKFDATRLVESINKYPKFWQSIKGNTLKIKQKIPAIEMYIQEFNIFGQQKFFSQLALFVPPVPQRIRWF